MSNTMKSSRAALDTIGNLVKRASEFRKKAGATGEEPDPGTYSGDSSHPTTSADSSTIDSQTGVRAEEHTDDLKHDQGDPAVDSATEGAPGGQQAVQVNIGTQSSSPGEDPTHETPSVGSKLDDPGTYRGTTTHPASLDNPAVAGKYSSSRLSDLIRASKEAGTRALADIVMQGDANSLAKQAQAVRKSLGLEAAKQGEDASAKLPPETVTGEDDAKPSNESVTDGKVDPETVDGKSAPEVDRAAAAGEKAAAEAIANKEQLDQIVLSNLEKIASEAVADPNLASDYLDSLKKGEGEGGEAEEKS